MTIVYLLFVNVLFFMRFVFITPPTLLRRICLWTIARRIQNYGTESKVDVSTDYVSSYISVLDFERRADDSVSIHQGRC